MDAPTPREETDPLASPGDQLVLEALGSELGGWVIGRIRAGDTVILMDDGSWFVGPGPGA